MSNTWILIANASEAHLYTSPKAKLLNGSNKLSLVGNFAHPDSRKKATELVSDRFGHTLHGTYVESSEPQKVEADHFAQELAEKLEHGRVTNKFDELVIIAPGHFQSLLKHHASHRLSQMIERTVDRDYTHYPQRELVSKIQKWL